MALPWLDPFLLRIVDEWYRRHPRKALPASVWQDVRIISHRGERDDRLVRENTYAAFDPVLGRVHGIECDIRFSRDQVPIIFHDATLQRVWDSPERLADLDAEALVQRHPQIPTLSDLIARYGGKLHLMIEVKAEHRADPAAQLSTLQRTLADLAPGVDYHLLCLDIPTLDWLLPKFAAALVPVARGNVQQMSDYALRHPVAAFTGHYALLSAQRIAAHKAAGQIVGIGFPQSRNALRFSVAQGSRWIFSNQALAMQEVLTREKNASKA